MDGKILNKINLASWRKISLLENPKQNCKTTSTWRKGIC